MAQAINESLMAYPGAIGEEQQQEAARDLRQKRRKKEEPEEAGEEPASLREQVMASKRDKEKEGLVDKAMTAVTAPVRMGTSRALQWAWGVLIPSWGLSLIYINMHVFLRYVLGEKLFCKLGEEWMMGKNKINVGGGAIDTASKGLGLAETMLLIFLDILVLIIIGAATAFIIMIVTWMGASWWEKLGMLWDAMESLGWAKIKALVDLFS